MSTRTLSDEDVDAIARRVADLIAVTPSQPRLVDAATLADLLGLTRDTIYANADQLGAIRIGDGQRPRLRFDLNEARTAWTSSSPRPTPTPDNAERASRRRPRSAGLLPIRGARPA